MFTLQMLEGNTHRLKDPFFCLTEPINGKSTFGNEPALHKTITIDTKFEMQVGGVYADMPHNTIFMVRNFYCPGQTKKTGGLHKPHGATIATRLFVQLTGQS